MFLNLFYQMYLWDTRPSIDPNLNLIETWNEFCIMIIGYCLLGFTDMVLVVDMKIEVGKWMMWMTIFNMIVNAT